MNLEKPQARGPKPPKRIRRTPIERRSAGTKRKIMPKCRHCGHSYLTHLMSGGRPVQRTGSDGDACLRCGAVCPGYEAARRGSRANRRSPATALRKQANNLWSKCVTARPGDCECPRETHVGCFQAAHGFGKKAYPAVRHVLLNGWKLRSGCHRFYTGHPIEWDMFMRESLGQLAYDELRYLAVKNQRPPLEETIVKLRAELAKVSA